MSIYKRDLIVGCITLILGLLLYFVIIPRKIPVEESRHLAGEVAPDFLGRVSAIGLMVVGFALAIRSAIDSIRLKAVISPSAPLLSKKALRSLATAIGLCVYVGLIPLVGYCEATGLFTIMATRLLGMRWRTSILWGLLISVAMGVLFMKIVSAPLPGGILSNILGY